MSKAGAMSASVIHVTVLGLCMILLYSTLSGLAGVYNEYILKDKYDVSKISRFLPFSLSLFSCTCDSSLL